MPVRFAIPVLLLVLLGGAGCAPSGEPLSERVVDDFGRTVELAGMPQRIVTLAPSATELAFAAGAGNLIVGVSTADDFPLDVATLPKIQALPVDFEAIVALGPDLVLASDQVNNPRDAETLEELGIPTYFLGIHDLDDVPRALVDLGELLGVERSAALAAAALDSQKTELTRSVGEAADPPRVLFLIGDEQLFSFGGESYIHEMIRLAGGMSMTESMDTRGPILSEEYVIDRAPDVIIGAFGEGYDPDRLLRLHPSWKGVPAIQTGRVYGIDPDLCLRPGPRLFQGTSRMAEVLRGGA